MSSQRYRAAEAMLRGVTHRPEDIGRSAWRDVSARHHNGTLFVASHAQMVAQTESQAALYDAFAHGRRPGPEDIGTTLMSHWRTFKEYGSICLCRNAPGSDHTEAPEGPPSALRFIQRLIQQAQAGGTFTADDVQAWSDDPDGQAFVESLTGAITGTLDGLRTLTRSFAVPSFYFSVRQDMDQNQPLEISYGATIRQKAT